MLKKLFTPVGILCFCLLGVAIVGAVCFSANSAQKSTDNSSVEMSATAESQPHPLSIAALRNREYVASEITIEETLSPGSNYQRYLTSYISDGNKIFALLTVPNGTQPEKGWPTIIFNHGYIPPKEYRTTEKYIAYTDGFSRNGYIVFRPDYRGHGSSEGEAEGAYGSPAYTIDVLNALASLRAYDKTDANRIGMWGHSMGGYITLRSMVVAKDIRAGVIWAGVVASYPDLLTNWRRPTAGSEQNPSPTAPAGRRGWRNLVQEFGSPQENAQFWQSISATSYLSELSGPIQLHHGTADVSVPVAFSEKLADLLKPLRADSELFIYAGDDHNLSENFSQAMRRSVEFFDTHVKNAQ